MNSNRAPKQWSLTKNETITTFEAWRQNLQYSLSLDANFAPFLADTFTWLKTSPTASHAVRRAQCYTLRAPPSTTVLWPGDYVELDVPPDLGEDCVLALQPRTDTPVPKHTNPTSIWPEPQIVEAVGAKVRLVNSSQEPKLIGRHEHLSQILPTEET